MKKFLTILIISFLVSVTQAQSDSVSVLSSAVSKINNQIVDTESKMREDELNILRDNSKDRASQTYHNGNFRTRKESSLKTYSSEVLSEMIQVHKLDSELFALLPSSDRVSSSEDYRRIQELVGEYAKGKPISDPSDLDICRNYLTGLMREVLSVTDSQK
jgi:hypothetical protein